MAEQISRRYKFIYSKGKKSKIIEAYSLGDAAGLFRLDFVPEVEQVYVFNKKTKEWE